MTAKNATKCIEGAASASKWSAPQLRRLGGTHGAKGGGTKSYREGAYLRHWFPSTKYYSVKTPGGNYAYEVSAAALYQFAQS